MNPTGLQNYTQQYFKEAQEILSRIDSDSVEAIIDLLVTLREKRGRLFMLGVGGSAANCSHAVNDFRKLCGIESYTPTDNVSELTARINDDGWENAYRDWLKASFLSDKDVLFVLSVGGGSAEKNISMNLVKALEYGKSIGAKICGIVGPNGGYTVKAADACVKIPVLNTNAVTPHSEAFQAVVWHLMVSHPRLQNRPAKWESTEK